MLSFQVIQVFYANAQNIQLKNYYEGQKTLREVYFVKDTNAYVLDGLYVAYYANGKEKTRGSYKNNLAIGQWDYFFENGAIKMIGTLEEDGKSGKWQYFYENGKKSMEGMLQGGRRNGNWSFYYENGKIKNEGKFEKGKRVGSWKYYHEDGLVKADATYASDEGVYTEYYTSGVVKARGINKAGKSHGLWNYYYPSGNVKAEGNYEDGLKNGHWKYFHENGKVASEGEYQKGKPNGKWTYYYESGTVSSEGVEKEGAKDGYWKLYHKSGVFKGESTFVLGEGPYTEYYPSGKLKISGFIKNDKNEGKWTYYYEDGALEGECIFNDGEGKFKGYYKNKQLRMEGTIKDGVNVGVWKLYENNGELAGYYTTVYDDEGIAAYAPVESKPNVTNKSNHYEIPEFLFKNKKSRYFNPKVNEFKGIIIAANPVAMAVGSVPFSIEYYMQERLGYELLFNYMRNPFFVSDDRVDFNELYKRGFAVRFKQKFYQPDQKLGMLYFGHELSFSTVNHFANINDPSLPNGAFTLDAKENKYEYALIVGNRMMKYAGKPGLTVDMWAGIGLGFRDYSEKFPPEIAFREIFEDVRRPKFAIPFRLGINFGYAF